MTLSSIGEAETNHAAAGVAPDKNGLDPITIVIDVVDEHPPFCSPRAATSKSAGGEPSARSSGLGERVLALATGKTRRELYAAPLVDWSRASWFSAASPPTPPTSCARRS